MNCKTIIVLIAILSFFTFNAAAGKLKPASAEVLKTRFDAIVYNFTQVTNLHEILGEYECEDHEILSHVYHAIRQYKDKQSELIATAPAAAVLFSKLDRLLMKAILQEYPTKFKEIEDLGIFDD